MKEETKATIRVPPGRGVPLGRGADDVPEVRASRDSRGAVGEGVLTPGFARVDGALACEGVSLERIAREVGTPAYVYSAAIDPRPLRAARRGARRRAAPHPLHAQGELEPRRSSALLRELGAGVDIVSGGELYRALRAGFAPEDIIFGGVGKTRARAARGARAPACC